jgi:hypothetical protein
MRNDTCPVHGHYNCGSEVISGGNDTALAVSAFRRLRDGAQMSGFGRKASEMLPESGHPAKSRLRRRFCTRSGGSRRSALRHGKPSVGLQKSQPRAALAPLLLLSKMPLPRTFILLPPHGPIWPHICTANQNRPRQSASLRLASHVQSVPLMFAAAPCMATALSRIPRYTA